MGDDAAGNAAGGFLAMAGFAEGGDGRCGGLLGERLAAEGRR